MASSILTGLKKINKSSHGFMVCLSDMPKIKPSTYNKIINHFNKNKKIPCVPCYKNRNGNPVCFPISFKSKIKNIKGCLLYTSPSPRDRTRSRMPSSA